MSILQTRETSPKKSPLKPVLLKRFHLRSLTEHTQSIDSSRCRNRGVNNIVLPLMQKNAEFPSILIRHNRQEYIGYKQNILNKSKLAASQEQSKLVRPQTQRKHDGNLMNVQRLKKRYSLQPNDMSKMNKECQKLFTDIQKKMHNESQTTQSNSQRNYHQQLREIMRLMAINKHSSDENINLNKEEPPYQQRQTQNLSYSQHSSEGTEQAPMQSVGLVKTKLPFLNKKSKPFYAQLKRRVQNKLNFIKKQKEPILLKQRIQVNDLCGWSTHSFYSKCRGDVPLEKCQFEKLEIIQ